MKQKQKYTDYKDRAIELRHEGKTYRQIQQILKMPIPKSTLSTWLAYEALSPEEKLILAENSEKRSKQARDKGLATLKTRRMIYLQGIRARISRLESVVQESTDVAKITLAMLYWCEGTKGRMLSFGNSDPALISLFFLLMRRCYLIDESKFRITLQCRADQDIEKLERFWSSLTGVPRDLFYGARIDPRTIGKPTQKPLYKGVCRIEYFSADIYNELRAVRELFSGPVAQLVEHYYGIVEATGPNPVRSTH